MKITTQYVIYTPVGNILATEMLSDNVCRGTMAASMMEGEYSPLIKISFPVNSSVIAEEQRVIQVREKL